MSVNSVLKTISRIVRIATDFMIIMLDALMFISALAFWFDGQEIAGIGFMFLFYGVDFTRDRIIPMIRNHIHAKNYGESV